MGTRLATCGLLCFLVGTSSIAGAIGAPSARETPSSPVVIEQTHASLASIIAAIAEIYDRPLELDSSLEYKRLHVYTRSRAPVQLLSDLAFAVPAHWAPDGNALRLSRTKSIRDRIRRLQRNDPDTNSSGLGREERARSVALLARAVSDPTALDYLKKSNPMLARSLEDPVVRTLVQALSTLDPYQLRLTVGDRGLRLPRDLLHPGVEARLTELMRKTHPSLAQVSGIDLMFRSKGDLILAVHMADEKGGSSMWFRAVGAMVEETPRGAARSRDRRSSGPENLAAAGDLPQRPRVRPAEVLVRSSGGLVPYKLTDTLRNVARKYSADIIADVAFRRPRLAERRSVPRAAYQTLLQKEISIGEFLNALAATAEFEYTFRDNVHHLRYKRWYWEEKYAHSDVDIQRMAAVSPSDRGKLDTIARMLYLSPPKAESLSLVFPELDVLVDARSEVELYASLTADQRGLLSRLRAIPSAALSLAQQRLFGNMLGIDIFQIPSTARGRFLLTYSPSNRGERLNYELRAAPTE